MSTRFVPAVAAAFASVGDLLMLYVAAVPRGDGADVFQAWMLLAGHYLGVLAIPVYALGYWQVSAAITRAPLARTVRLLGAAASALGATIHGITGVVIGVARSSDVHAHGAGAVAPFTGIPGADLLASYAEFLLPLWVMVTVLMIAVSVASAAAAASGASRHPRWAAVFNPAALVVYIALLGTPLPAGPFVVAAAPNLAHLVFFALTAALDRGRE